MLRFPDRAKISLSTLLASLSLLVRAQGQTADALIAQLQLPDETRRAAAAAVMADPNRSAEANTALIALLAKEDDVVREAFREGPGASAKYGEGYSDYVAHLADIVMSISAKEPQRKDVWPALLNSPYDPESGLARWFSTHGDKTASFLLASATSGGGSTRADALLVLAQTVAYERESPPASRHLSPGSLRTIEMVIRAGLTDPETIVRLRAVKSVALMGTRDDAITLDRIAASDPYVMSNAGPRGDEERFPIRDAAREAAEKLRARLDQRH